jgi:hypothetical protein
MSTPRGKDVKEELINIMSSLNMEPSSLNNGELYLADNDQWCKHAMEHLISAIETFNSIYGNIVPMDSIPPNENPFIYDLYNMSTYIGTNVVIIHEKHTPICKEYPAERQPYIIIVNTETGERVKINF